VSEEKKEETKLMFSKKKKVILVFVILGLLGGGYYGKLWLEAQNYGVEIKNLKQKKEAMRKNTEFYNNF